MKPFRNLAETKTPDGARLSLHEHDGDYFMKLNGKQLMSSTSTVSEIALADLACGYQSPRRNPCVLIGGLGLGYSLKRVLELVDAGASVHVAELIPEVVSWNRELLRSVNGDLLDDPRVKVFTSDVFDCIQNAKPEQYDAILLDVDNGPTSFVYSQNSRIYKKAGLNLIRRALKDGGRVAFWSAEPESLFYGSLGNAKFHAQEFHVKAHERAKRSAHRIYVGERRAPQSDL